MAKEKVNPVQTFLDAAGRALLAYNELQELAGKLPDTLSSEDQTQVTQGLAELRTRHDALFPRVQDKLRGV